MIKIEVDRARNLFVLHWQGHIIAQELEEGLEQIREALAPIKFGFRLLGDFTELESMEPECAPFIEKAMDLFNAKGVAHVVRVIPDPHRDIGMGIMSIFHYRGDVRITTCQNLAEAANLLAS